MADALSRVKYHLKIIFTSTAIPTWIQEVTESYKEDTKCQEIIAKLLLDQNPIPNYTLTSGVLRYKHKLFIGAGSTLKEKLIQSMHTSEMGGHSGEKATYQRIKLLFHWPGLKQQVIDFVKECPTCQLNKSEHCKYPGLLQPLPIPNFAWTHISMILWKGYPSLKTRTSFWW